MFVDYNQGYQDQKTDDNSKLWILMEISSTEAWTVTVVSDQNYFRGHNQYRKENLIQEQMTTDVWAI